MATRPSERRASCEKGDGLHHPTDEELNTMATTNGLKVSGWVLAALVLAIFIGAASAFI
jgi:hypothetical protein